MDERVYVTFARVRYDRQNGTLVMRLMALVVRIKLLSLEHAAP